MTARSPIPALLSLTLLPLAAAAVVAAPAAAAPLPSFGTAAPLPSFGTAAPSPSFGTAAQVADPPAPGSVVTISSVTIGRNDGFDRVVFTLSGPTAGYRVEYVPRLVQDGSGATVPITGGAILSVTLSPTDWTVRPAPRVNRLPGFPALRQLRSAGEFEGVALYGIGQTSRAGFRVLRLTGPDRIVVDVAHPRAAAPTASRTAAPTSAPAPRPAATTTRAQAPAATTTPAPTATPAVTTSAAAAPPAGPGPGGLAETGDDFPIGATILGAVLLLGGLAAAATGVHLTRHPTT